MNVLPVDNLLLLLHCKMISQTLSIPTSLSEFLTLGLSSVKRKKDSYLIQTLRSLFTQSSAEERSSMVVVVLLADFDASWRAATVEEIKTAFSSELEEGQLVVLHVPKEWYPVLTGAVHVRSHGYTNTFMSMCI